MRIRNISKTILSLALLCFTIAEAKKNETGMKILTPSTMPAVDGPSEYFTGSVKIVVLVENKEPSNLNSASVTFQPGARSAWHTHPRGQLLVVTEGTGRIQEFGKPIHNIKPGDVIWTPPGVRHWHGASPEQAMTHIATHESLNGSPVKWMEKVTDQEYNAETK